MNLSHLPLAKFVQNDDIYVGIHRTVNISRVVYRSDTVDDFERIILDDGVIPAQISRVVFDVLIRDDKIMT